MATDTASSIKVVIGTTERVAVVVPGTLANGNYFVQISDTAAGDANFNSGTTCSEVKVTHSPPEALLSTHELTGSSGA